MPDSTNPGTNLGADLALLLNDSRFHDVTLICSDGVELGATRSVLAARCAVFSVMLYGEMRERDADKVALREIKSDALRVVLLFIYTGEIESALPMPPELVIQTYRAATFFLLPNLMKLVMEKAEETKELDMVASLINEAVAAVHPNEHNIDLYNILLKPFRIRRLVLGDLNGLSADALEFLLKATLDSNDFQFKTSENDLLLCVIEWAWASSENTSDHEERHKALGAFMIEKSVALKPNKKLYPIDDQNEDSVSRMMQHINVRLICAHRLARLMESIDGMYDIIGKFVFLGHYGTSIHCPSGHPTEFRGKPQNSWNPKKLGSGLVLSENDTVVEYPKGEPGSNSQARSALLVKPIIISGGGICEWDIIIESTGVVDNLGRDTIGMVGETIIGETFDTERDVLAVEFSSALKSNGFSSTLKYAGTLDTHDNVCIRPFGSGDVISFYMNLDENSCAVSINGTDYGVIYRGFLKYVYPAVTLFPQARYRLRMRE